MSPVRSLDLERKEELLINKQLRQSSTKILRRNLPTLIEASPDFSQKKLPYLPNLPPSVQVPNLGPGLHNWFDTKQVQESDLDETPLPSLCSTPSTSRSRKERSLLFSPPGSRHRIADYFRPDSRSESLASCRTSSVLSLASRRSRSSSITFDLEESSPKSSSRKPSEEKRSKKEKERRRPTKQEGRKEKGQVDSQAAIFAGDRADRVHQGDRREHVESQAAIFAEDRVDTMRRAPRPAKEDTKRVEEECGEYSMWSCRRCTLENRLTEESCQACGGSRLSSIGEVCLETMEEVKGQDLARPMHKQDVDNGRWSCLVCTLSNPHTLRYCDACNSINPYQIDEVAVREGDPNTIRQNLLMAKAARIFGLGLLAAIFIYFIINVVVAGCTLAAAGLRLMWQRTAAIQPPRLSGWEAPRLDLVHPFSYEYRGLNCLILATFVPIFFYLIQSRHHGAGHPVTRPNNHGGTRLIDDNN